MKDPIMERDAFRPPKLVGGQEGSNVGPMIFLPLAGKGRRRPRKEDNQEAEQEPNNSPCPGGPRPSVNPAPRQDLSSPQPPQQPQICDERDAMAPGDKAAVKGQELDLHEQQQKDRRDD
jgi:hypothetical protein